MGYGKVKKAASILLAASLLMTSACKKSDPSDASSLSDLPTRVTMDPDNPNNNVDYTVDVVRPEDPYYEVERKELVIQTDPSMELDYLTTFAGPSYAGQYITWSFMAKYVLPPDIQARVDQMQFPDDYDEYVEIAGKYWQEGLAVFDASGEYLFSLLADSLDSSPGMAFETASGSLGMTETTMGEECLLADVLMFNDKGEQTGKEPLSYTDYALSSWNGKSILLPSGNILLTNLGTVILVDGNGKEIWCLPSDERSTIQNGSARGAFYIDGKVYLYYINDWDYPVKRFVREIDEMTGKPVGDMLEISSKVPETIFQGDNACFAVGANGIVKVDLLTGDMEAVINWNETDINWYNLKTDTCQMISEGEICFLEYNEDAYMTDENPHAYVTHFKRTATNPHAGKTLLHLSAYGLYDSSLIDLLIDYNKRPDGKARVMTYDTRDNVNSVMPVSVGNADMAYKIFLDMKSGTGPDLLMNFTDFGEFENEEVLCDLNTFIDGASGIDRSQYFDNIFRAFETDGKLFQMPLLVQGMGLVGNADLCGQRSGWTYSDFLSIVKQFPTETTAFFSKTAEDFMVEMLSSDIAYFVDYAACEAKFDSAEFKQLLEIARLCEVQRDRQALGDDYEGDPVRDGIDAGLWATVSYLLDSARGLGRYRKLNEGRISFMGFPSASGSGFGATANMSIAISSFSKHKEEAWDFVMYLLEKDAQVNLGDRYGIPVNRAALDEKVEMQIEEVEKMNQNSQNDPVAGPPETIEEADIAMFINQIEHIDRKIATYPAILTVVKEEAAAYFAGQKSADDVAAVIQNRVMLILQESQ
ncbi:MAG: extracellular solute-binding protein [Clostridiales bacterium]|nr:extracellular solute-binding protein [Clostridiales bacterium]